MHFGQDGEVIWEGTRWPIRESTGMSHGSLPLACHLQQLMMFHKSNQHCLAHWKRLTLMDAIRFRVSQPRPGAYVYAPRHPEDASKCRMSKVR